MNNEATFCNIISNELANQIIANFGNTGTLTTLLGWIPEFNSEGLPLNANPNKQVSKTKINNETYVIVKCGWQINIYKPIDNEIELMPNMHYGKHVYSIDTTPSYLK